MPIYKMTGKKNGKQRYRVRINYTDNYGKAHQTDRTVYGLEEAKMLEYQLTNDIKRKKETPAASMTISDLYSEYINAKRYEVRETTLDKSVRIIARYIIPECGSTKLSKFNVAAVQKWKMYMEGLNIGITTKRNVYGVFHAMINYAVKMEYMTRNVLEQAGNFKAPLDTTATKEMQYYTADEFKRFIAAAKSEAEAAEAKGELYKWNFYVFFNIAFYTGMRKGEINALQWTDIKDGRISITKSVAQKLKGPDRITPPKNKSSIRTIQIPLPLMAVLEQHKERCSAIDGFAESWYICGGVRCIRDTSVQKTLQRCAEAAGVKAIRVHDFRHSHASLLANEGINIQEIARRLGHAKISMTWDTYSHLYPREEERAVKILNNIKNV